MHCVTLRCFDKEARKHLDLHYQDLEPMQAVKNCQDSYPGLFIYDFIVRNGQSK